eukprot:1272507-Amphidinium_carterae.1
MLSGRSTLMVTQGQGRGFPRDLESRESILRRCCERLDVRYDSSAELVHGSACVPRAASVSDWPGIQPCGKITEYQLVFWCASQASQSVIA